MVTPEQIFIARQTAQGELARVLIRLTTGCGDPAMRPVADGVMTILERVLVLDWGKEETLRFFRQRALALEGGRPVAATTAEAIALRRAEVSAAMAEFYAIMQRCPTRSRSSD